MFKIFAYTILSCLFYSSLIANNDTIPPAFTVDPQNVNINCDDPISLSLESWINTSAGAEADNGEAIVNTTINFQDALIILSNQFQLDCPNEAMVEVGFFATDSCGNNSLDTLNATFFVNDNQGPRFTLEAISAEIFCNAESQDSLFNWISNYAGAIGTDNCSDSITWINYNWSDNYGNSGFGNFTDSIEIDIPRDSCHYLLDVSFFASDGCENLNSTSACFKIVGDTILPQIISSLVDTIIDCGQTIDTIAPVFFDDCDGTITPTLTEINNQDSDSLSCNFYNYQITRFWLGSDVCGNAIRDTQIINVQDTIAPEFTFEEIVAIDCSEDLSNSFDFISVEDNCYLSEITFVDSLLTNSKCQEQIERTYTATDICGNSSSAIQIIQRQDFSGPQFDIEPKDTTVSCGLIDIETVFQEWIDNFGGASINDNCNNFSTYARAEENLTDTTSIINASPVNLKTFICDTENNGNSIIEQVVQFYTFDICGNISKSKAIFELLDSIPPVINNCPANIDIILPEESCDQTFNFSMPDFEDACLTNDNIEWTLILDDIFIFESQGESLEINIDVGNHILKYEIQDCGSNVSSCIQNIILQDTFPPDLECPQDMVRFISQDTCGVDFTIPEVIAFNDNCFGNVDFSATLPPNEAFIDFQFDNSSLNYKAQNFQLEFDDIITEGRLFKPVMILDYALNVNPNSSVRIISEFGDLLYEINEENCQQRSIKVILDENQFSIWSQDNDIKFTVLFEDGTGEGTTPCNPDVVEGFQDIDEFSFLSITLEFSDIVPNYILSSANGLLISENNPDVNLDIGFYEIEYSAEDQSGNIGTCISTVEIRDTIPPQISCSDVEFYISPNSSASTQILIDDLIFSAEDNCGPSGITFSPAEISCLEIGNTVDIQIQATDDFNNISQCISQATILADSLKPSFVSGLCLADSLKLFSNIDINQGGNFNWTGPDGFSSFLSNPILTSINDDNSGVYSLEFTNTQGCIFFGETEVMVSQFASPEITSENATACLGEELLLNSNSFTEIVDYFWYEGISPNGTLIGQSDGPTLSIIPTEGPHFYYVEVKGENCNSNPSNTLTIDVISNPIASIDNPFITVCQGDDIILSTSVFDQNYIYEWRGPDNYFSNGQIPTVINNAAPENSGNYTLIIKQDECASDTVNAQVVVFDLPPTPIISGENIFCQGQTAVLSVSNIQSATRYHWYNNGILFNSVSTNNLLIPSITELQNGEWFVIVEDGICSSDTSDIFEIFVEATLNIGASNNGPLCEGDDVQLTSSFIPNATYQWEDPEGDFYSGREIIIPAINGIYNVTVTTQSNCTAVTSTTVVVGLKPSITALSNTALPCMNGTTPITLFPTVFPSGNYQYEWTGPNGFTSNQENPKILNANTNDIGNYTLTVNQGSCDSDPVSTIVDFTVIPIPGIITGDPFPCEGDDVTLTLSDPITGNQTFWIWSTPSGSMTTDTPFLIIEDFNANDIGDYFVIQELNSCRSETSAAFQIDIQNNPPTPIINRPDKICEFDDIVLSTADVINANYIWITPQGTITTSEPELVINNINNSNEGIYQLFIEKGNCVSTTSENIDLEIQKSPKTPQFVNEFISLCTSSTDDLTICLNQNIDQFDLFRLIDINSGTVISESTSFCFDVSFLLSQTNTYQLAAVTLLNGCASLPSNTIEIEISDIPNESALIDEAFIYLCDQEFVNITSEAIPDDIEILWSSLDPEINIFDTNAQTASFSNLREGENVIILSSSFGNCLNYFTDTVRVIVLTELTGINDNLSAGVDETVIIEPLLNDLFSEEIFISNITNPENGEAVIVDKNIRYTSADDFIGTENLTYFICYEDCPDICASATIQIEIEDNRDCFAGNIITPNGDGYNDAFVVPCLNTGLYETNSLVILNQWGDEVFNAAPYQNDWQAIYNGNLLPVGTYFYILDLGDGSKPLNGYIILEQ